MKWTSVDVDVTIDGDMTASDERPSRPHTSFSQLSMYMRCSMQYYFAYIKKWSSRPSLALKNGSAGHQALEWYAKMKKKTGQDQPEEALLDVFSDAYDLHVSDLSAEDLQPGDDIGNQKDATAEVMRSYRRFHAPQSTPLVVEYEFNLDLPPTEEYEGPIRVVNGRIDIVDAVKLPPTRRDLPAPIRIRVKDYKFSTRTKGQDVIDMSHQLSLYDVVASKTWTKPPDEVGFQIFIPPTTKSAARIETVMRSPHEMQPAQRKRRHERLIHALRTTQRAIDAGIFQPTDDPRVCSYCGFRPQCQFTLVKSDLDAIAIRQHEGAR